MADTLKFGPEWLRQLSGGNSVASPPPTPGLGSKFKIAEYRYGREEMLALFHDNYKAPDDLVNYPPVYVEESQKPLALVSLTEEEQRLMSQSVNSTTVLRSMGRGGQPLRGGRGGGDRGRGRGRGRGDGFPPRGGTFDPAENGGFGRARGQNKDGWEEVGKKYDRSFSSRNPEEVGPRHPPFSRSLSSDNWREKDETVVKEEEGGDWRRAGPQKERWGPRSNWREPAGRGGFDGERRPNGPIMGRGRDIDDRLPQRRTRTSESWDTDDLPEWSTTGEDDMEELGTFDSSGQFVTTHPRGFRNGESFSSESYQHPQSESVPEKDQPPKEPRRIQLPDKKITSSAPDIHKSAKNAGNSDSGSPQTVMNGQEGIRNDPKVLQQFGDHVSQTANNSNNSMQLEHNVDARNVTQSVPVAKVKQDLPVAESEALSRLQETAENMVADMTVEDETPVNLAHGQAVPLHHEDSMKWFYRDPQGDVQGPFNPDEMAQWFSAGYFTMSLLVKRGCDERFQQLGELIKKWGRVPFLAGPSPPPLMNTGPPVTNEAATVASPKPSQSPVPVPTQPIPTTAAPPAQIPAPTGAPTDPMGLLSQQFLLQQMQQQMMMRNMQVQMFAQLQEQESFKSLDPTQQQAFVMQMLMQSQPVFMQQMQQLQQLQQQQQQQQNRISPQPPTDGPPQVPQPTAFNRSMSQPVPPNPEAPTPVSQGTWPQTSSVWDLETPGGAELNQQHLEKLQAHQKAEEVRRKQEEEERRQQLEMQRTQEELKRQQEEIAREREKMLREKEELDRQRQLELKRLEDIRQEEEERKRQIEEERKREERRIEEERRKEERRRQEEELAAQREVDTRRKEQERRQAEEQQRRIEELQKKQLEDERRKQEVLHQQELQRQQEEDLRQQQQQQQQQEEEERQREILRQQEMQRQEQHKQQQEALRRLQQQQREQLARMQLPVTAQWANQSPRDTNEGKSLAEIQQEEERQAQERERQLEIQRQQMIALQQQQQQQQQMQKSWAAQMSVNQAATKTLKSLLDIQEEQAKQVDQNKKKQKAAQQAQQTKVSPAATLSTPSLWSNVASNGSPQQQPSGWGGTAVWGGSEKSPGGIGIWDDAVISSKKAATKATKDTGEFPALGGKKRPQQTNNNSVTMSPATAANRKQMKPKKEEDTVQKLFQSARPVDDFTQWCERALAGMASSVDVPTFIAFLQDVESPYEVHDYVRSYLGESGAAKEFGRQFLEKRSQYKQKARLERQQEEDSIWGPAPAVNPKESRMSNINDFESVSSKNKKKNKKGKMQKLDKSILGFTVHADPTRVNAGEIENAE